jgi:hypothetical protein
MHSLKDIQSTLQKALGSPAMFSLVNTRLMLRTGVDLNSIKPPEDRDQAVVTKVLSALDAMGYSKAALVTVAQRNNP